MLPSDFVGAAPQRKGVASAIPRCVPKGRTSKVRSPLLFDASVRVVPPPAHGPNRETLRESPDDRGPDSTHQPRRHQLGRGPTSAQGRREVRKSQRFKAAWRSCDFRVFRRSCCTGLAMSTGCIPGRKPKIGANTARASGPRSLSQGMRRRHRRDRPPSFEHLTIAAQLGETDRQVRSTRRDWTPALADQVAYCCRPHASEESRWDPVSSRTSAVP